MSSFWQFIKELFEQPDEEELKKRIDKEKLKLDLDELKKKRRKARE